MDLDALDRVLELYDKIVLACHELCGTEPTRRERFVADEQISLGYLHSGHPIMSHLDYHKLTERNILYVLDAEAISNYNGEGDWAIPHELGHNHQKNWWTFSDGQLAREFGWDSFKAVFRTYEKAKPTVNSDQEKIDLWVEIFSQQVKKNLVPLFRFWGLTVSDATLNKLKDLEIPKITDKFIDVAPDKYQA
ncbi:unnamed protein product [Rotaria sp. Silwood1]|nr:unnamed protein product [Rotaria sp. Silwood1]CAF1632144.1 unnamed protein product [Rotaria sp. Silwood1]